MTRDEAISKVEGCLTDYFPMEDYGKVEKIIKALKQEPCEDTISRQAAIEAKMEFLNPNVKRDTKEQTEHDRVFAEGWNACNSHWIKEMENLPSAQPEPTEKPEVEEPPIPARAPKRRVPESEGEK